MGKHDEQGTFASARVSIQWLSLTVQYLDLEFDSFFLWFGLLGAKTSLIGAKRPSTRSDQAHAAALPVQTCDGSLSASNRTAAPRSQGVLQAHCDPTSHRCPTGGPVPKPGMLLQGFGVPA